MPGMPPDSTSIVPFSLENSSQQPPIYPLQHGLSSPLFRVHVSWSRGNILHVTCLRPPAEEEEEDEAMHGNGEEEVGGKAVEVTLGGAMLEGEIREDKKRRIAYESVKSFAFLNDKKMSLAKMEEPNMTAPSRTYWWQYALEYSRSINDLLSNPKPAESLIQDPKIFLKEGEEPTGTKGAWELMEIFYVDIQLLSWLPERLIDWLEDYDSLLTKTESKVHSKLTNLQRKLFKLQIVENDSDYWGGLASALSVGWLDIVVKLLRLHGSYDLDQLDNRETENGLVEAVKRLVTEMPRMRPNMHNEKLGICYQTKQDYIKGLEKWRGRVSGLESTSFWIECKHHKTRDGLKNLLQIMLGNMKIIFDSTYHWLELFISHLLYIRPLTNGLEGMNNIAEKCMQLKPPSSNNGLSGLLIGIVSENPEVVLADCLKTFGPWIVAHAVDLLTSNSEYIDAVLNEERYNLGGTSIGEIYVLVYAQALASHPLTWQVAPAYLSTCLNQGQGFLEVLFLSQPVQNYRSVLKTLEICHLYDLANISPQIMKNAGMNQWKRGNKALAIHWFKQSRDKTVLSRIAQQLFDYIGKSVSDEGFKQLEGLMELLGSDIGTAGGLDFLHKYRDFKRSLQQKIGGEKDAACKIAELLIQLMKNPSTPQRFWLPLLHDSVKLLEWKDGPILNVRDTTLLLGKLQELSMAKLRQELHEFAIGPNALASIRLALAKNLGRAILQES